MAPIGANPNPNPNPYLDIEKIRTEITMAHILNHYEIELTRISQNHLAGCCPIHKGDNSNAFHVDLEKNLFHCFTHCGGGSIFDFVMKKENLSFYQAAKKVWKTFYPREQEQKQKQKDQGLHFQLKLQPDHPYLRRRNIDVNLARHFQMGFCQYGMMKNRIAIPIFDQQRKLVAYCGRAVEEHMQPKYLFPKNFTKSHYLFNIQNIDTDTDTDTDTDIDVSSKSKACHHHQTKPIFIVEGFFDCIHLVKLGFEALAVMGSSITHQQLALLKQINRFYILMLDGDEAGTRGMTRISQEMRQWNLLFKPVWLKLIDVKEPEELGYNDLEMIANETIGH